jgi:predicted metal-dependent HD superfamily phosphohydrolase
MSVRLPTPVRQALGETLIDVARSAYATPGRHYHTWQHIQACLKEAGAHSFDDPLTVYAALLFHDALYLAGAKDNEARSAELADQELRRHTQVTPAQIARVRHLILLTASHDSLPGDASRDDQLLVDIDLGILATPPAIYDQYAANVRLEWLPRVVTKAQYETGRGAFLRRMLAAPRIFHSAEFAARETIARTNISRELASLSN